MPLVLTLFAMNCVYVFPFSVSFMIPSFAFLVCVCVSYGCFSTHPNIVHVCECVCVGLKLMLGVILVHFPPYSLRKHGLLTEPRANHYG